MGNTNKNRQPIINKLIKNGFKQSNKKSWDLYINDLYRSKFVLCLEGNGLDTHRVWETYLVNSIPVVLSNSYIPTHFYNMKMLVVNNFDELTPAFLEQKYIEINTFTNYNYNYLNLDYWKDQFENKNKKKIITFGGGDQQLY